VNFIKDFQGKLPCTESSAELRDSLNLSLLLMHKYYKKARIRCLSNGGNTLESSLNLSTTLTGAASPLSPYISQVDRFDWRWINLDVGKLSASFGHGDKANFVPEIFFVIKDCDLDQLKKIVDDDDDKVNELDAFGRTTAMYAANGGTEDYLDCLKFLISKGVDLQHQSTDGFSCLHIACFYGYKEFVTTLLEAKVEMNCQDSDGRSPLHFAAAYCSQDILQLLLANGADPNAQDSEGLTPSMWACHFDQLENLQILLAINEKSNPSPEAKFQVVDNLGRTILHWAVSKTTNTNCMQYLLNAETAQLCDDEGKTIFLFAAEHGCVVACEEIFNMCSEDILEDVDNFGRTALHLAALGGHGEVVEFLLNRGAVTDRKDCQGVSPMHLVTSRKLNYCNLVFTSYQRYKERLENLQANLDGAGSEKNVNEKLLEEKNVVKQVEEPEEDYGIEIVKEESKNKRGSDVDENDNKNDIESLKIDCQDAVGFEIEGDIEEEAEFDVMEKEVEGTLEIERPNLGEGAIDNAYQASKEGSLSNDNEQKTASKRKDEEREDQEKNATKKSSNKASDVSGYEAMRGAITKTSATPGQVDDDANSDDDVNKEEKKNADEQVMKDSDFEVNDIPPQELEVEENSEKDDYDFEDVSIGSGGQKIVLVAHHEGGDHFDIDFGDDVKDLEFQDDDDDGDDDEDVERKEENIDDSELQQTGDFDDAYKISNDRDLSPKIESVTRLLETNTVGANQSVSMNMSLSSLRSDSEDEEAAPSGKDRISKLDSKIPVFDTHHTNQLEYRDPFVKARPLRNPDESDSLLKRGEDSRPKTSHGKRKEKKEGQKNRQSSPRSKQHGGQSSPRLQLGTLEPMKPLQPIIPAPGIQGARVIGGNYGSFPGGSYDSMRPSSPRSPHERSNALSSPGGSPRSKGNQLSPPRGGFDGRDGKLSHIPRPSSPSSRDRHLPTANNKLFAAKPLGR